jgi:uncharacterized membrane protein YdjX (TVP38/TMEM64 family)
VGGPAVRALAPSHKEQRVRENARGDSREERGGERECRTNARVDEPDRESQRGVVEQTQQRVLHAEQVGAGRRDHAWLPHFPAPCPPALGKHEKRGVEPNTAQQRDDYPYDHRLNRHLRKVAALALLAASFLLAFWVIRHQPRVEHEIRTIGALAYPLAVVIFGLVASAPFSVTDALAIMNGALFGPIKGTLVDTAGLILGALFGYWLNRHASRLFNLHEYLDRVPAWVKRFPVGSPGFLLAVRIIPGFGGTVATATAAALRVPVWVHVDDVRDRHSGVRLADDLRRPPDGRASRL